MKRCELSALVVLGIVLTASGCRGQSGDGDEDQKAAPRASQSSAEEGQAGLVLDTLTERRIGLVTEPVRTSTRGAEITLAGELIADPAGSSILRAPIAGKLVSVGHPWPTFGESLSAGSEIAQVADARPLLVPRGGIVVRVMAQPGELVQAGQDLLEIADYSHALARIAWRNDAPSSPPGLIELSRLGTQDSRVTGRLVGPAAEADPLTRREAWLYRTERSWPGARPGNAVVAFLPDPGSAHGSVFVPLDAVVQWESLAWVFVEHGRGRFVRNRIATDHPVPGGWLVREGVGVRDTIVVRGAEQLLSEEFRAHITVGEEVRE